MSDLNPKDFDYYDKKQKLNEKKFVEIEFSTTPLLDFEREHGIPGEYSTFVSIFALHFRMDYMSGPWFAGGLYRRALQGEKFSDYKADVDIFFNSKEQWGDFYDLMRTGAVTEVMPDITNVREQSISSFSKTFLADIMGREVKIQCIDYKFFTCPETLLKQFDLFSCMFATDGANMVHEKHLTLKAAKEKHLKYNWSYLDKKSPTMMFAKRFLKFIQEGYSIENNEHKRVIRQLQRMEPVRVANSRKEDYGNMSTNYVEETDFREAEIDAQALPF